ncbi:hypothetical protein IE077_002025, partial [Cardiosporidium cionae]
GMKVCSSNNSSKLTSTGSTTASSNHSYGGSSLPSSSSLENVETSDDGNMEERNYNSFGPFLYDMSTVAEDQKFRLAFLLVDYPGYGNSTGYPSPTSIRSAVFQALKHGIKELLEIHNVTNIVLNIHGYSLGCAVAE